MSQRHGWDIRTRMLAISLGPALLLTLLLTAYFTYSRLQDLRQELTHTGQLIADQLAPAAEYGAIAGNTPVLQKLLQATLDTPHVRFIEVRDRNDNILVYVEQLSGALQNAAPIDIFHSTIQRQRIALARALYGAPTLVVLDEPNSNLDDSGEQALQAAIQALKARGCTVLLITHRAGVLGCADRLLALNAGQLHLYGERDQVLAALNNQRAASASQQRADYRVAGYGAPQVVAAPRQGGVE